MLETLLKTAKTAALPRDHVGALAKGLAVLEILAAHPQGQTLTDVAIRSGMDRAGARRLLITLEAEGYATLGDRLWRLSPKLLTTARTWISGTPLWTFAEPFMREASMALGESCSAAVLAGPDIVYVARVASRAIMTVSLDVGSRLPAWCTSMGRVLLADMIELELDAFLATLQPDTRTPKTITAKTGLRRAIMAARVEGFAIIDEELELGLRSIAVPVKNRAGRAVAAINISAPSARFTPSELRAHVLPHLRKAAASIENHFLAA